MTKKKMNKISHKNKCKYLNLVIKILKRKKVFHYIIIVGKKKKKT